MGSSGSPGQLATHRRLTLGARPRHYTRFTKQAIDFQSSRGIISRDGELDLPDQPPYANAKPFTGTSSRSAPPGLDKIMPPGWAASAAGNLATRLSVRSQCPSESAC